MTQAEILVMAGLYLESKIAEYEAERKYLANNAIDDVLKQYKDKLNIIKELYRTETKIKDAI